MSNPTLTRMVLALTAMLVVAATRPAVAGPTSVTGEHDIAALLERAEQAFDVAAEDAVFLLDSAREDWTGDGRRIHARHRIVLIRTGQAIRQLADLRIPYDAAHERFTVTALRTWRLPDQRWIESGPTAQVETLPFALDHAPDYAHRREMMLLHDGVELPCILETAYAIEDREPFRAGTEGRWSLARAHPAVVSRFVLGVPAGSAARYAAAANVPEPTRSRDGALGLDTLTFETGPLQPAVHPQTPESMAQDPHVVWSTFADWPALGRALHDRFVAAEALGDELRQRLDEHLEAARTPAERAWLVAKFAADSTRHVEYGSGWWPAPRSAARTWETAYGNRIDRAVLAWALYRAAGLTAAPVFLGNSFGDVDVRVAHLSWTQGPGLWIEGEDVEGYFDPVSAEFVPGPSALLGRAVWRPASGGTPSVRAGDGDAPGTLALRLELRYDGEAKRWHGRGVLTTTGALSPFSRMAGLEDEARTHVGTLAGAVLDKAEVTGYSPAMFEPARVAVGFDVEAPVGERDALGRLPLKLADPGALEPLLAHAAVHLHEERRGSAVVLPAALEQRLELHLDPADLEVVHLPAARRSANGAGSLTVTVEESEGKIALTRELVLTRKRYAPEAWPALRQLLLADGHDANRLILLK